MGQSANEIIIRNVSTDVRLQFCCEDDVATAEHWSYLSVSFDSNPYKQALRSITMPSSRIANTMLCAIFLNACKQALHLLYHNMKTAGTSCSWFILAYRGEQRLLSVFERHVSTHPNITIRHIGFAKNISEVAPIYCKESMNAKSNFELFNYSGLPKSALHMELLPYLPEFERVFILDDDIDISEFSFDVFHDIMTCGFQSGCGPVLVQPLVAPQRR